MKRIILTSSFLICDRQLFQFVRDNCSNLEHERQLDDYWTISTFKSPYVRLNSRLGLFKYSFGTLNERSYSHISGLPFLPRSTMDRRLVEAALSGNETTLNALIHEDPLILHRISLTSFDDTPLHIAALCGNLDFLTAILSRKPRFLTKLDSFGRCPLHLACAEGHCEIVKRLFQACPEVSKRRDQDGRTPLELAALNEHVDVLNYLIQENPFLAKMASLDGRGTILHLCIRYNSIGALKLLAHCWSRNEVINFKDDHGNNLLHFAAIHKQIETVKYLLGEIGFGENWNSINKNGFTAVDVLDHCPRDWRSWELQDILMRAGVRRAKELTNPIQPPLLHSQSSLNNIIVSQETTTACGKVRKFIRKAWHHYFMNEKNWVEKIRGNLLVTATLIATISFQAGLNPPGGVWQESNDNKHAPGNSIFAFENSKKYLYFVFWNTLSLISSSSIILLMTSGFPLNSRAIVGILMVAIFLTMWFMLRTYYISVLYALTPSSNSTVVISASARSNNKPETYDMYWEGAYRIINNSLHVFSGVCIAVVILYCARFLVWLLKWIIRCLKGLIRCLKRNRNVLV